MKKDLKEGTEEINKKGKKRGRTGDRQEGTERKEGYGRNEEMKK